MQKTTPCLWFDRPTVNDQCGWLKGKSAVSQRVMLAVLKMNKLDIETLEKAYHSAG